MSADRGNLHRLVDQLDDEQVAEAAALLHSLAPAGVPHQPRRRLSFICAYDSGQTDTAARSGAIRREGLGAADPHGR